jgi:hypothetical protein
MSPEFITASEYLEAEAKARRNRADRPAFKRIEEELKRLPKTQERLAFELLKIARAALDQGKDPGEAPLRAMSMARSITPENRPKYLEAIEDMAVRCFELMAGFVDNRFTLTFVDSLFAIRTFDKQLLSILLDKLRRMLTQADSRREFLVLAEESESQIKDRIRVLRSQIELQLTEDCKALNSNRN